MIIRFRRAGNRLLLRRHDEGAGSRARLSKSPCRTFSRGDV